MAEWGSEGEEGSRLLQSIRSRLRGGELFRRSRWVLTPLSLARGACFQSVREGVEITGAERANHICRHLLEYWGFLFSFIIRTSVSASCSPALARKTSLDTTSGNTETLSNTNEEQGCSEAVSGMSNQVRKHLLSSNKGILQSSYLSQISQIILVEKNMSCE